MEEWVPKTKLGWMVKNKEITNIEDIFVSGKKILEPEIVDILVPNMQEEVIQLKPVQRVTDSGRKMRWFATVAVGNKDGIVGIGMGKGNEVKQAIEDATKKAKMNIIKVWRGCGSWECGCGEPHSLPTNVEAKVSSVYVKLKPAPRGLGLAAGHTVKTILDLAGVKDVWSFSRGQTDTIENTAQATIKALSTLNNVKIKEEERKLMK